MGEAGETEGVLTCCVDAAGSGDFTGITDNIAITANTAVYSMDL